MARIDEFLDRLHDMYSAHYKTMGYTHSPPPSFSLDYGNKYIRVVTNDGSQRSVYCFIDAKSGDILKAAGWKAPAKGARGSIWNDDCDVGDDKPCNVHGSNLYR